jgi:hypothetical protein
MHPCPTCACHVRVSDATCPHCGQPIGSRGNRMATAILALGLAGCTGGGATTKTTGETGLYTTSPQPAYGITVTDTDTDTGTDTGSTWTPQPAYGITVTDTGADSAGDTGTID